MGNQPRTIQVKLFLKDEFEAFEQGCQLFIAESNSNRSEAEFIGVKLTNLLFDIFFTEIEKVALTVSVAVRRAKAQNRNSGSSMSFDVTIQLAFPPLSGLGSHNGGHGWASVSEEKVYVPVLLFASFS